MSVPVRYSAAANYAVADNSGCLTNTLNNNIQGEQYQYANEELYSNLYNQQQYHYQQQEGVYGFDHVMMEEQQQLMQQSTSMSVSAEPSSDGNLQVGAENSAIAYQMYEEQASTSAEKTREVLAAGQMATASAMVAAAAESANTAAIMNGGSSDTAEMRTDWNKMSDEGGYGTPGAAGLEYQKFEQQQQQQQHHTETTANLMDQNVEPSLTDNEKNKSSNNNDNVDDKLASMSCEELYNLLKEYDVLQDKYHTILLMPRESKKEVTAGGRDGSAYVLRCLKIWYELPSDVLFTAMSLVDRFLDRMTVKPKHMACLSVASFYLAIKQWKLNVAAEDLVNISQCGCTARDLERMTKVIANKLGVQMDERPITPITFLRIYYVLFRNLTNEIGGPVAEFFTNYIKLDELENRLEALLCDVKTTVVAPSTLALVLICLHLDFHIKKSYERRGSPELKVVFEYIIFLQKLLNVPDQVFSCGFSVVGDILSSYNNQNKQPYKQRLVWRLSSRTLRCLRPTTRFSTDLPTIDEGITNAMDDGLRSRTESVSSEEEEDWPTSPIIPIFEEC